MKLFEVLHGYENGKFKDGDIFFYHNNPNMAVIFNAGSLIWTDDRVAVSCKEILKDVWVYKEAR